MERTTSFLASASNALLGSGKKDEPGYEKILDSKESKVRLLSIAMFNYIKNQTNEEYKNNFIMPLLRHIIWGTVLGGTIGAVETFLTGDYSKIFMEAINGGTSGINWGVLTGSVEVAYHNVNYYKKWQEETNKKAIILEFAHVHDGEGTLADLICPFTQGLITEGNAVQIDPQVSAPRQYYSKDQYLAYIHSKGGVVDCLLTRNKVVAANLIPALDYTKKLRTLVTKGLNADINGLVLSQKCKESLLAIKASFEQTMFKEFTEETKILKLQMDQGIITATQYGEKFQKLCETYDLSTN